MTKIEKYLRIASTTFLSRNDLEQMLSSRTIEEAVDRVAHRPLGSILKREFEGRKLSLEEIFKVIFKYYLDRRRSLYQNTGSLNKILEVFDEVFDAVNIVSYVVVERAKGRCIAPLPFGKFVSIVYEKGSDVDKLLKEEFEEKYKLIRSKSIGGYTDLINIINTKMPPEFGLDYELRKTYGFLRDSVLLRTCIVMGEEPAKIPLLYSLMRDQFYSICRVKDLKELPHVTKGLNPLYDVFSEALHDVFNLHVGLETFDLAVFLTIHYLTQCLNQNLKQMVAKTYLQLVTESVMLRLVLSCLEANLYLDEVKSLVNKWWVITRT